jgi:phosphate/sulfate permease
MISPLHMVFFLIALAFIFDVFNGFHDAANSVATVVTTRVLTPIQAVFWATLFNFVAAFLFGTGVAKTISDKLIDPKVVDLYVIFGGLVGAIVWDIITWLMALPTSSSHAIISAYAGGAIAKAGFSSLLLKGWVPVVTFLVVSPIIGLILGYIFMLVASWFSHKRRSAMQPKKDSRIYNLSRLAPTASVTAPTTLKRRWASSPHFSSPQARKIGPSATSISSGPNTNSPCGSSSPATPPWPSARSWADGVSSRRWARASRRTFIPWEDFRLNSPLPPRSVSQPLRLFPSPRRTQSAAPSPEWVPLAELTPFAGSGGNASSGLGY